MADNDYLRKTLEHYRQQREAQLSALRKTEAFIVELEAELGEPSTVGMSPAPMPLDFGTSIESRPLQPASVTIQPDDFFGMTQTQAARAYLQRVKRAVSIEQIVDALQKGGAQLGGADPKKTLYVSLARNPERLFVIPREGYFGLREFYPSLPKTVSKPKTSKKKTLRSRGHRGASKKAKPSTVSRGPRAKPETPETPIKSAVERALADGKVLTIQEIVASAEKQLSRPVTPFGVRATLRGKAFVREGDKYKLAK